MTPTLAMVVMRDAAIRAFKPEPFYSAELKFQDFQAGGERMKEKAEAEKLVAECCQAGSAIITKVVQKEKSEKPPALFDLTSLQREANRQLGFTAQQTLDYTQAPVSYTHLDGVCRIDRRTFSKCIAFEDISYQLAQPETRTAIFEPVSYTHLDVYKRQVLLLPELPTKPEKNCFPSTTRKTKTTAESKRKWFTRKSCCRPMPHPNMQTEQRSGTLPRK